MGVSREKLEGRREDLRDSPEAFDDAFGGFAAPKTPVLLLVFNRPEFTEVALQRLREVQPSRLYVAADGPRHGRSDDQSRCEAVRALIDEVDWPCDVHRRFQDSNLGCKRGVESGINWFFSQVERGIILEDDCIPDDSFFPYAESLLSRYADDERVMMISGTNRLGCWPSDRHSYHFTRHGTIWGWATWRRAWEKHDVTLAAWEDPAVRRQVAEVLGDRRQYRMRAEQIQAVRVGQLDTWDYGWLFTLMRYKALTAVPSVNLVSNIGFGPNATHTFYGRSSGSNIPRLQLAQPLIHPPDVVADRDYDAAFYRAVHHRFDVLYRGLPPSVKRRLKLLLSAGRGRREPGRSLL